MARDRRREDDDEDDRPQARRRRDEEEDDEEPRPRRKPRPAEDDERPRRKARARDDDEEDDHPRREGKSGGMSKGLLFGLIGGGVALVAVVLLIVFLGGSSPKSAYEGFVKAARSGDFGTVYESLDRETQSAFDAEMRRAADRDPTAQAKSLAGKELFVFVMAEAKGKGMVLPIPTSDPKILDEEIDGNSASLRLVSDQGKLFTVKLVREGRKWKVSLIGQMRKS